MVGTQGTQGGHGHGLKGSQLISGGKMPGSGNPMRISWKYDKI